jgi:hypothetical protein
VSRISSAGRASRGQALTGGGPPTAGDKVSGAMVVVLRIPPILVNERFLET